MNAYKMAVLAVMAVISSTCIKSVSTLSCYSCSSDSSGTDANGCGANPTTTTTVAIAYYGVNNTCASCMTMVNGVSSFSRGCSSTVQSVGCSGSTCYCNTDNCNNNKVVYGRGTLQCYSCTSVDYMDNGCGDVLDPKSIYVKKLNGCFACSKYVTTSQGGGIYTRGCVYTTTSSNQCAGSYSFYSSSCFSKCESNLCNSATTTSVRYPVSLVLIFAIYGCISWM